MVYEILSKTEIAPNTVEFRVHCPHVARSFRPGQFLILKHNASTAERIPLSVADFSPDEGTLTLVVMAVGRTSTESAGSRPHRAVRQGESAISVSGAPGQIPPKKVAWIVAWNYREIRRNFGESRDNANEAPETTKPATGAVVVCFLVGSATGIRTLV